MIAGLRPAALPLGYRDKSAPPVTIRHSVQRTLTGLPTVVAQQHRSRAPCSPFRDLIPVWSPANNAGWDSDPLGELQAPDFSTAQRGTNVRGPPQPASPLNDGNWLGPVMGSRPHRASHDAQYSSTSSVAGRTRNSTAGSYPTATDRAGFEPAGHRSDLTDSNRPP